MTPPDFSVLRFDFGIDKAIKSNFMNNTFNSGTFNIALICENTHKKMAYMLLHST